MKHGPYEQRQPRLLATLEDPRTGEVRWVGCAVSFAHPLPRGGHWSGCTAWMEELAELGLRPTVVLVAVLEPEETWRTFREFRKRLEQRGARLLGRVAPVTVRTEAQTIRSRGTLEGLQQDPALILEPVTPGRTGYTQSRVAILPNGDPILMLLLLAGRRWKVLPHVWQHLPVFPFWLDGNHLNEVGENIGLAQRPQNTSSSSGPLQGDRPNPGPLSLGSSGRTRPGGCVK